MLTIVPPPAWRRREMKSLLVVNDTFIVLVYRNEKKKGGICTKQGIGQCKFEASILIKTTTIRERQRYIAAVKKMEAMVTQIRYLFHIIISFFPP
jgi:hypothetical protein